MGTASALFRLNLAEVQEWSGVPGKNATANLGLTLRIAERNGQRCGGPILLSGLVLGIGVVQLATGPLGQTSRFSLELLVLLMLQLVGPMLMALLATALLLPRWLEWVGIRGGQGRQQSVPAALVVGALLQLMLVLAAVSGGILATPRSDLIGEWRDLLSGLWISDLLRSMLRAGVFLAAICSWTQTRALRAQRRGIGPELQVSNLLVEGLLLLLLLKLIWILAVDPLHLSMSAQ